MSKQPDIKKIKAKLKKTLDKNRYKHTKNVAETARCLAMRYKIDLEKAYIAGLLHDCAKCLTLSEKEELCKEFNIKYSESEKNNPALVHATLGPYIAKRDYHIDDPEIADAIRYHTTGRKNMSVLEKIIYIADYIEPGRPELPRIETIRMKAFLSIDTAMAMITEDSLNYLKKKGGVIDPKTQEAYDFYSKKEI